MFRFIALILFSGLLAGCVASFPNHQELPSNPGWPTSCDAVIVRLSNELLQSDKAALSAMTREELPLLHLGLGTQTRNNFGLWSGNVALAESCSGTPNTHPDTVSTIIIERLWESLQ